MAVRYLNNGRDVWKNHIPNPDFEIDASHWRPLNASSVIDVVTGHQFRGGKALRITGTGSAGTAFGASYDGLISVADIWAPLTTGSVNWVVSASTDHATGVTATMGVFRYSGSTEASAFTSGTKFGSSVNATPKRLFIPIEQYVPGGLNTTHYVRPTIHFTRSGTANGVFYIDGAMLTTSYAESFTTGQPGFPDFIAGSETDGYQGLSYEWSGTPHDSISTATALRWVNIPDTGVEGQSFTITGGGFIASESVQVLVDPLVADSTTWQTTANSDGTFSFTFTMPKHTGGTGTKVRVSAYSSATTAQPYAEQAVIIPVVPPLTVPENTADQVVNYYLDPRAKTTDGTTVLAKNYFWNPSPTDSLAGYAAAGTASIALDPTSSIKGAGGVKVTSSDASSGIEFRLNDDDPADVFPYQDNDPTFTVYVRARQAMTITGSATSTAYAINTAWGPEYNRGWGDYGWGEPYTYVQGAAHTFAAGEVKRFRIMPKLSGYVYGTDPGFVFKLAGSGVFDVDAVWVGSGVDDGVDPEGFPGGISPIPDAPLWFSGDTPDTEDFIYEWQGTPRASTSIKKGHQPKFFRTAANNMADGMETVFTTTLPTGETAVGHQSSWDESGGDFAYLTYDGKADGVGEDLRQMGLATGKNYAVSFDLVSVMENYIEGYIGGSPWAQLYLEAGDAYIGLSALHPMRERITLPVTINGYAEARLSCYRNWYTGYHAYANVAINEIDLHTTYTGAVGGTPGTLDLLALGAVAGRSYGLIVDTNLAAAGEYYRVEAQVGGAWQTAWEFLYDATYPHETVQADFTIPANATACRLAWSTQNWPYFDIFAMPVPFFDGDTPDGGGFAYSWSGTPHESASIRTVASTPTINAQVFVGGTAKPVSEMRAVKGGTLTPVSQIGT